MRILLVILLTLATSSFAGGNQTDFEGRAIPAQQVTWRQYGVSDELAQSYLYRLYIIEESGASRVVTLGSTLCGGSDPYASECSTALPTAAAPAVITGNWSSLTATDRTSKLESIFSVGFEGDQGCIFRARLYAVGQRRSMTVQVPNLEALLAEFQAAKFKHISTSKVTPDPPPRVTVTEECVGYLVY